MTNKNNAQNEVINVKEELKNEQCPKSEDVNNETDVQKLLEEQRKLFMQQQKAFMEEMNGKIESLVEENTKLTEELNNLKSNTEEENRLLGQQIAKIKPNEPVNTYNPYAKNIFYEVYNSEAKATTIMTGDEVECIVGVKEYITKNLKEGAKSFEKHPYKVKLLKK